MGQSAALIQARIDVLETFLGSADSLIQSVGSDGTSLTKTDRASAAKELRQLYMDLGRVSGTSPMLARGRLRGLR